MEVKTKIVGVILGVAALLIFVGSSITSPDSSVPTNEKVIETKLDAALSNSSQKAQTPVSTVEQAALTDSSSMDDSQQISSQRSIDADSNTLMNSEIFDSPEQLDSAYINDDESLNHKTIESSFSVSSFNDLIGKIRSSDDTVSSSEREILLADAIAKRFGSEAYSEDYSCAGRVCAVAFFFDHIEESELHQLGEFASNYSFVKVQQNENGDNVFKAIFIETDDPSSLVLH
ncbi:hypothetical protein K0504_12000 [Neiella marina]|uniref:Uncharacterized protein n=1 Tax=Neiella holothuriorum TaxID=2870530 RepID=A0ABS7EHP9_9GAMM|nr:hypothetical protein [Neiella holothuriorum]MBW8191759.1 hypothetical protein [Neiella holothuriorum]